MEAERPLRAAGMSDQEEAGVDGGNVPETLIRMKSIMFLGTYEDSVDPQNLLEIKSSLSFFSLEWS